MKSFRCLFTFVLLINIFSQTNAQNDLRVFGSDSITLAEAYINLTLTKTYFDSLSVNRISKIIPFEENELNTIKNPRFIEQIDTLYKFTNALLYLNKALFVSRDTLNVGRQQLIEWKNTLEKAIVYFNSAKINKTYTVEKKNNVFYELIKFDTESCFTLESEINSLKDKFTPIFNNDIYPDFKRIFMDAKASRQYDFDGLVTFASIYNFPLRMKILNNEPSDDEDEEYHHELFITENYKLDLKLDLISRYLQLKYIANVDDSKLSSGLDFYNLYDSYYVFHNLLEINDFFNKDSFFSKEINSEVCDTLYDELQKKFPYDFRPMPRTRVLDLARGVPEKVKYFFPNPAPLPSAHLTIRNYKQEIRTLGKVDTYLSKLFNQAGYKDRLHYYYDLDGYAMTTSLEKFNRNGLPIEDDSRWYTSLASNGKFSFFEIFKSIFFEVESEFRLFAVIVASKNVAISEVPITVGDVEELLKNSYPKLPDDLKDKVLHNKNLTVLVYHFHQNDVGEVPMLDLNGKITAEDHLKNAKLIGIIGN